MAIRVQLMENVVGRGMSAVKEWTPGTYKKLDPKTSAYVKSLRKMNKYNPKDVVVTLEAHEVNGRTNIAVNSSEPSYKSRKELSKAIGSAAKSLKELMRNSKRV